MIYGYPRLLKLAERFREILDGPAPMDDEAAELIREFLHRVENLAAISDRDVTIHISNRCGQIQAEIKLRFGVDPETDWRRDHLLAKGRQHVAPNKGTQIRTKRRLAFLREIVNGQGDRRPNKVLAYEAATCAKAVDLWGGETIEQRERKIERFLKDHRRDL